MRGCEIGIEETHLNYAAEVGISTEVRPSLEVSWIRSTSHLSVWAAPPVSQRCFTNSRAGKRLAAVLPRLLSPLRTGWRYGPPNIADGLKLDPFVSLLSGLVVPNTINLLFGFFERG